MRKTASFWAQYIAPLQKIIYFAMGLFLLVACEPEATPIAMVEEATSVAVSTAVPTNPPNLRYGIFVNADGYVSDLAEIESRASVEIFYDAGRYVDFDIVAAYGIFEGWQVSPVRQHLVLTINPNLAPLDNETIRAFIPQIIDSQAIVGNSGINGMQPNAITPLASSSVRTSLANIGFPDGFQLSLAASPAVGLDEIIEQFNASNIRIQLLEASNQAHLSLDISPELAEGAIEIYSLPISYIAREGISVEFSENGWPLPSR